MDEIKKDEIVSAPEPALGRRDMIKLGVGAGVAMAMPAAAAPLAAAAPAPQFGEASKPSPDEPTGGLERSATLATWPEIAESQVVQTSTAAGYNVFTGPGWVNNSGRAFGNGPMDVCTKRLVDFTVGFSEAQMTPSLIETINNLMIDTLSALYLGFEGDPARINSRLSQRMPGGPELKATVLGYGIVTTPEMAAFTNGAMIRTHDFNIVPHNTETMGGILAMAEINHWSGMQVMMALTIAYEAIAAIGNMRSVVGPNHVHFDDSYLGTGVALACGKFMGLNADELGNAVSLALLPHLSLYTRVGVQTMWKGCHSSESVRNGVWAAMLAQEGMTGPPEPFEGRDGLLAHLGPPTRDMRLPFSPGGLMAIEAAHGKGFGMKSLPIDFSLQNFYQENIAPPLTAWTEAADVERIDVMVPSGTWTEVCDAQKWDPRNFESCDHSMPYIIARSLLDKEIYLDSLTREKYMDPKVKDLMAKIFIHPITVPGGSLKARKKSGEERVFPSKPLGPMTRDKLIVKYNRAADYNKIDKAQAARALQQWTNLKDVKDINEAIATLAKFGQPRPLSDKTPTKWA